MKNNDIDYSINYLLQEFFANFISMILALYHGFLRSFKRNYNVIVVAKVTYNDIFKI